jgi:SPP1 gp7 family putative phage head morphogenesis protein
MYRRTDIILKYLVREYIEMFAEFKASLLQKDELNTLQKVNNLYTKLALLTWEKLLELGQLQYEYIQQGDYDLELIDSAWLQEIYENYNETTKYVYANEIDRKRSYLFEALMSGETPSKDIDKALRLWSLMVGQMAVDVTDKATYTAYKENGVRYVKWVSEHDSRRCDVCAKLDGKIFPIDEVPPKQHINCRCFTIPVRRYKK